MSPAANNVRRVGVLVVGMHRSGTSALTRLLASLGCDLPSTLMEADSNNAMGYWESTEIADLNDEILVSAGSSWDDWEEFNPDWYASLIAGDFRERARAVLASEFGNSRLFVLKDPRVCRLLEFWKEALDDIGVIPVVALPTRNPLEVAASLRIRDAIDPSIALLIWLRNVLDAEASSRGLPRAFTRYGEVFDNWKNLAIRLGSELEITWPRRSINTDLEVESFISSSIRHHEYDDSRVHDDPLVSQWVKTAFEILDRWTRGEVRSADADTLDSIRSAFNECGPHFSRPIAIGGQAAQKNREYERQTSALERTATSLEQAVRGRDGQIAELDEAVRERDAQIADRDERLASMSQVLNERDGQVADRDRQLSERDEQVAARDEQLASMSQLLSERDGQVADRDRQLSERDEQVAARDEQLASMSQLLSERDGQVADRDRQLSERDEQVAARDEQLASMSQLLSERDGQVADRDRQLSERDEQVAARDEQLASVSRLLSERDGQVADRDRQLSERDEQVAARDEQLASMSRLLSERDGQVADRDRQLSERDEQVAARDEQLASVSRLLSERDGQVADRDRQLSERDEQVAARDEQLASVSRLLSERDGQVADLDARIVSLQDDVAKRDTRIQSLDRAIVEQGSQIESIYRSVSWRITRPLRFLKTVLFASPRPTFRLPGRRRTQSARRYIDSGRIQLADLNFDAANNGGDTPILFDPEYYLTANEGLVNSGTDPLRHYLDKGAVEGRFPFALESDEIDPAIEALHRIDMRQDEVFSFDAEFYRELNPDLVGSDDEALLDHYRTYGRAESRAGSRGEFVRQICEDPREIPLDFKASEYVDLYPDLDDFADRSPLEALRHYMRSGRWEARLHTWRGDTAIVSADPSSVEIPPELMLETPPLCVLVHIFYPDLWEELAGYLANLPASTYDLHVNLVETTVTPELEGQILDDFPDATIHVSQNIGRDIGGYFQLLRNISTEDYQFFCLIHSKKSPHLATGDALLWRRRLLTPLLGTRELAVDNMKLMLTDETIGLIGSRRCRDTELKDNTEKFTELLDLLDVGPESRDVEFLSGTMMYMRREVLQRVFETCKDLPFEKGDDTPLQFHLDAQWAHAIERVIGNVVKDMNYRFEWR